MIIAGGAICDWCAKAVTLERRGAWAEAPAGWLFRFDGYITCGAACAALFDARRQMIGGAPIDRSICVEVAGRRPLPRLRKCGKSSPLPAALFTCARPACPCTGTMTECACVPRERDRDITSCNNCGASLRCTSQENPS